MVGGFRMATPLSSTLATSRTATHRKDIINLHHNNMRLAMVPLLRNQHRMAIRYVQPRLAIYVRF